MTGALSFIDALREGVQILAPIGTDNPRQQVLWMLGAILNATPDQILVNPHRTLSRGQVAQFRGMVARRRQREPLQYILGTAEFRHIVLKSDRRALIPRPETEGLVEIGLDLIRPLPRPLILDMGTGSGAIALSLLDEHTGAQAVGCDLSADALDLAAENAIALGFEERVSWRRVDLYEDGCVAHFHERFDLVVCNPPYVADDEYQRLAPEIREHEPAVALLAGADGMNALRRLAKVVRELLHPGRYFICEIGETQAEGVRQIYCEHQWHIEIRKDLSEKPRYLIARPR